MRCQVCNQSSVNIEIDENKNIHITCDICGYDIRYENSKLCDLILFNYKIEKAEELGRKGFIENKKLEDNPYFLSSEEIILNKRWEEGWEIERAMYEREAFSSSSEIFRKEILRLEKEVEDLNEKNKKLNKEKVKYLEYLSSLMIILESLRYKNHIFGGKYKKDIKEMFKDIKSLGIEYIIK